MLLLLLLAQNYIIFFWKYLGKFEKFLHLHMEAIDLQAR
jgi:hypothetical protein